MIKRQNTSASETATHRAAPSQFLKGRKARTPVEFCPSAKGLASTKPRQSKKLGDAGVASTAPAGASVTDLFPPWATEGEVRDIGELTFGRRAAPRAPERPGIPADSAANPADRSRVTDLTQPPWRKICDLLITAADGTRHSGTGWFISPRTLVTAGHCVFVFSPGNPAHGLVRSILVMPARNGETSEAQSLFGWAEVRRENLRAHTQWVSDRDLSFDFGAIILPPAAPPIGQQVGFFGYGHFLDQDLDESAPVLSGYPDNVPEGTQWAERNLIKRVTPTRVFYDIFTFTGQSGSPLFFRNNNRDIACAIHNFGEVPLNSGVRINPTVVAQLNAWRV